MRGWEDGQGQEDPREEGREGVRRDDLRVSPGRSDQDQGSQEGDLHEESHNEKIPFHRRVYFDTSTSYCSLGTCLILELFFMHTNDIHVYVGEPNLVHLAHGMLEPAVEHVGLCCMVGEENHRQGELGGHRRDTPSG